MGRAEKCASQSMIGEKREKGPICEVVIEPEALIAEPSHEEWEVLREGKWMFFIWSVWEVWLQCHKWKGFGMKRCVEEMEFKCSWRV